MFLDLDTIANVTPKLLSTLNISTLKIHDPADSDQFDLRQILTVGKNLCPFNFLVQILRACKPHPLCCEFIFTTKWERESMIRKRIVKNELRRFKLADETENQNVIIYSIELPSRFPKGASCKVVFRMVERSWGTPTVCKADIVYHVGEDAGEYDYSAAEPRRHHAFDLYL